MQTLSQFLTHQKTDTNLVDLIDTLMVACKEIAIQLREGALAGVLGTTDNTNVQGETQKKLDVIANDVLKKVMLANPLVAGIASEEEDDPVAGNPEGRYLIIFDPLDGSSNIDVNVSVGTIFSILELPKGLTGADEKAYLQTGRAQVASGYVLYGPSAVLTLTTGNGVNMFTLAHTGDFLLTEENVIAQLRHLQTHPSVASKIASGQLFIHGWVYDIETSEIRAYDAEQGTFLALDGEHSTPMATPRKRY